MNQTIARMLPNVRQLHEYTQGAAVPPLKEVLFAPGGGRGRPRKGAEAVVLDDKAAVAEFIKSGAYRKYKRIVVTFHGDHNKWPAEVEQVFEKLLLVVKDVGIVASVHPDPV
jgi:hypothetical protein